MKKRKDCIFGMHFDFHALPDQKGLGGDFRIQDYVEMLDEVKPDVIQIDTKGHPGVASYPTALGNAAPDMQGDMLTELRRITREKGVLCFSHYSGVWDVLATDKHPEYRAVFKGIEYRGETSVFSAYAEALLIPQLLELAGKGMDGVWIDGECWATQTDYSDCAINAYREKYGEEPDFENGMAKYENFCREGFYAYVKKYTEAVHSVYPDYEIASNWLGTTFCPCSEDLGVDFITGDYEPSNSVNTARFQSKALVRAQKHWELLSWGFNIQNGYIADKSAEQIKQEVSAIYHCGGAVSLYYTAIRGNIKQYLLPVWKDVAEYCKKLGAFTRGGKVLPEIAVLQSEKGFYKDKKRLFSTWDDAYASDMEWLTIALSDLGLGVEVAFTQVLKENLRRYSVVVVPDFPDIETDVKEMLVEYVRGGGKLLLAGCNAVRLFAKECGIDIVGETEETGYAVNATDRLGVTGKKLCLGGESNVDFYDSYLDGRKMCAAMIGKPLGRGRVCALPFAFGKQYGENRGGFQLRFLERALKELDFTPFVRAYGHDRVDVVPTVKDGKVIVHLLNLSGAHADANVRQDEYIPPLTDVCLETDMHKLERLLGKKDFCVCDREGNPLKTEKIGDKCVVKGINIAISQSCLFF